MANWGDGILEGACMTRPHKLIADPEAARFRSEYAMESSTFQRDLETTREVGKLLGSTIAALQQEAAALQQKACAAEEDFADGTFDVETATLIRVQRGPSTLMSIKHSSVEPPEMGRRRPRERAAAGRPRSAEASAARGRRGAARGLSPRGEPQVPASIAASAAAAELEGLREVCRKERKHSERHAHRLRALRVRRDRELEELRLDVTLLSNSLEEKEQDVLSLQFELVEARNRLHDQTQLVREQADVIQEFTQELADKEQKLESTTVLLSHMSELSDQLQTKVMVLNQELEGSRAAQEALGKELQAAVAGREPEQQLMLAELERVRAEAGWMQEGSRAAQEALGKELQAAVAGREPEQQPRMAGLERVRVEAADLRAQLRQQGAAAAGQRCALERELQALRGQAERSVHELEAQLRSEKLATARAFAEAGFREAGLLEELRAEVAGRGHFLRRLRASAKAGVAAGRQEVHAGAVEVLIAEAARESASHAQELKEQLAARVEQLASARDQLLDLAAVLGVSQPPEAEPAAAAAGGGAHAECGLEETKLAAAAAGGEARAECGLEDLAAVLEISHPLEAKLSAAAAGGGACAECGLEETELAAAAAGGEASTECGLEDPAPDRSEAPVAPRGGTRLRRVPRAPPPPLFLSLRGQSPA